MRAVAFLVEQRQQGGERRLDVAYDTEIDRRRVVRYSPA
jgi:hypothetical protein